MLRYTMMRRMNELWELCIGIFTFFLFLFCSPWWRSQTNSDHQNHHSPSTPGPYQNWLPTYLPTYIRTYLFEYKHFQVVFSFIFCGIFSLPNAFELFFFTFWFLRIYYSFLEPSIFAIKLYSISEWMRCVLNERRERNGKFIRRF